MKRAILLFTVVVSCLLLTSCGSESTSDALSTEELARQHIISAIAYYGTEDDKIREENIPLEDDTTVEIYYKEKVIPFSVSKSMFDFDYVDAYDPQTKYSQTIPDFEEAIEWYKYSYDSGTLSPNSVYKQDLDKWVNYYIEHPESIPVVSGKKNADAFLKYVQKKTGHSTYTPDPNNFGIANIRETYLVFNTDGKDYNVYIYDDREFKPESHDKDFRCGMLMDWEVNLNNAERFNPDDFEGMNFIYMVMSGEI